MISDIIIAIDGHSGCGKSTTAKKLAEYLNYSYLDSGAMYRSVTLYLHRKEIHFEELNKIVKESTNGGINEFHTFIEKYDLTIEMKDHDALKNFFESNEDCNECGIYVSYKKYF